MLVSRFPICIPDSVTATSSTAFTRKTNIQNYGRLIRIKCISVCNQDNGGTRVNVGYMRGAMAYYFDTLVLTNNDYFYNNLPDILIPSDYQIVFKFVTPSAGERYLINIMAEEEVYSESPNGKFT